MKVKKISRILKALADDTRIRIVNLLNQEELSVNEISEILDVQQSNLSKHLSRLRLTGIVNDSREGFNVYYSLVKHEDKALKSIISSITVGSLEDEGLNSDLDKMREVIKNRENND